jgi:xanthine/uracil/vitamin C permease (AzgA family)
LTCGFGSLFAGVFANLPVIIAPPTSVSVFLSIYLQQNGIGRDEGNVAVIFSGLLLILLGYRPLAKLCKRVSYIIYHYFKS